VLAAGSVTQFFGLDSVASRAFCLKDLADAVRLRNHVLTVFERACREPDPAELGRLLTFIIVGGGATGVELAGSFRELYDHVLTRDYTGLDFKQVRVILMEATGRLLPALPPELGRNAAETLAGSGAEALTLQFGQRLLLLRSRSQSHHGLRRTNVRLLRASWQVVLENRRAYVAINVVYYGLVLAGMAVSFAYPSIQAELMKAVGEAFSPTGGLGPVTTAYASGDILSAIPLTFGVNLILGTFLAITVPSLVVPFSGLLVGAYRAILWGLLLAPQGGLALAMIPHSLTLVLEGQAYILALLGTYTVGKGLFRPTAYGARSHLRGYLAGIKRCAWLYVLVILVLAVAAVYEALEVILIVARLAG
jgi:hypothetical protein